MTVEEEKLWWQRQPATAYCLFCPDWSVSGTAAEVRLAAESHRESEHPDLEPPMPKHRRSSLSSFRHRLSKEDAEEIRIARRRRMYLLGQPDE
jgi:hypothetical protein